MEDTYGIIVTIYFKSNNISYLEMHSLISHHAGTPPQLLTVGGNCNMEYRKWANCYMKEGRAERLARKVKEDPELSKMFEIKLQKRMGERVGNGNTSLPLYIGSIST